MKKNDELKLIVRVHGHYLELCITELSHPEALDFISEDCFDAITCKSILTRIAEGCEAGDFSIPKYLLLEDGKTSLVSIKGIWIRLPDYQQLNRIFMWEYNRDATEILTEDMFKKAFGNNQGAHYYSKWVYTYEYSIPNMITYLRGNEFEGQKFMSMIMGKVVQYNTRLKNAGYSGY
jgi:hypothetical protein